MKDELWSALYAKHPKILEGRGKPVGIACGEGWYTLLDELCDQLQHETDEQGAPQVVAYQIKEKLGGLRFYIGSARVTQHALIRFAEALSYRTCETCGGVGQLYDKDGWFLTRCVAHMPEGAKLAVPDDASIRIRIWSQAEDQGKDSG